MSYKRPEMPGNEIERQVLLLAAAKREADRIRNFLAKDGIYLKETSEGIFWKVIK